MTTGSGRARAPLLLLRLLRLLLLMLLLRLLLLLLLLLLRLAPLLLLCLLRLLLQHQVLQHARLFRGWQQVDAAQKLPLLRRDGLLKLALLSRQSGAQICTACHQALGPHLHKYQGEDCILVAARARVWSQCRLRGQGQEWPYRTLGNLPWLVHAATGPSHPVHDMALAEKTLAKGIHAQTTLQQTCI